MKTNIAPTPEASSPRTIKVFASSGIKNHPIADNRFLRERTVAAFQKQFSGVRVIDSEADTADLVVIFTVVDYAPGCLPNCKKFRTYRNWTCEAMSYPRQPHSDSSGTFVFNLEGSTYNPFYDPASSCASKLARVMGNSRKSAEP
ncbi:MAG TPA: hypothetical protein VKH81_14320 [Candidatus Angelobacter sp.]|nr:hypothetical protein [Candidatus Angelobacter sp.]